MPGQYSYLLDSKYRFVRKLSTDPHLYRGYQEIEQKINRVPAHGPFFVLDDPIPRMAPQEMYESNEVSLNRMTVHDLRDGWIDRIVYPEQLLAVQDRSVWLVAAKISYHFNSMNSYAGVDTVLRNDITIHEIRSPRLVQTKSLVPKEIKLSVEAYIKAERDYYSIRLNDCDRQASFDLAITNIVPSSVDMFSAVFTNKQVATFYAESLDAYSKLINSRRRV